MRNRGVTLICRGMGENLSWIVITTNLDCFAQPLMTDINSILGSL